MLSGGDGFGFDAGGEAGVRQVASTTTGTQPAWTFGGLLQDALVQWAGVADLTVQGIAGGISGDRLTIRNTGTFVAYFAHNSGSAAAADRLQNPATSGPTPIAAGGWITYVHTGTNWVLVGHEQGAWITRPFDAANFDGSASMDWTVDAGDVTTDRYRLAGRTISYEHSLTATTIGGTVSTALLVAVPGGYSPKTTVLNATAVLRNPTVLEACYAYVTVGATVITIAKIAESVLTLNTNGTQLSFSLEYDVD